MRRLRSLFVKVFLWFWLVAALTGAALFAVAVVGDAARNREVRSERAEERRDQMARTLASAGETAQRLLALDGPQALDGYSDQLARTVGIRPFFLPGGGSVAHPPAPPDVLELAGRVRRDGVPASGTHRDEFLLGLPLPGGWVVVGKTALATVQPRPPRPGRSILAEAAGSLDRYTRNLGVSLVVLFLVGGAACGLLTWHLASPLRHLRSVAQRLASGDLSARVDGRLARRGDEIADLGADLDRMAERIEAAVASQQRLLRDISHELRSPLARLDVALELARSSPPGEAAVLLDRIGRESGRLNDLVGRLLTLARLEGDGNRPARDPVDLAALIAEVAADVDFEARAAGRRVDVVGTAEAAVAGDRELLRSALENVVRNAVRYTREGTAVEVSLKLRAQAGGGGAVITVRDHGTGVPEGDLDAIFRPFHRVSDGRERESGGVGLGLAICDRAVRRHGGTVTAGNAEGGGLVVRIELALRPD